MFNKIKTPKKPIVPGAVPPLPADPVAALASLEWVATKAVDGLLSGKHPSRHRGGNSDFAEHRGYQPGDDLRRIDWRLHARNDRYHVRTYDDETNLRATIAVDASGSMGYRGRTASKFDVARVAAVALARMMMRQRDAVGLAVVDQSIRLQIPPGLRPATLHRIEKSLAELTVDGQTNHALTLRHLLCQTKRRGLLIFISDCFGPPRELGKGLAAWSAAGHEVIVVRVLAPEELDFDFRGPMIFESLEGPASRIDVDAGNMRSLYLQRFNDHRTGLDEVIRRSRGWQFVLRTDQSIIGTLRECLIRRAAAAGSMSRGGTR